jgi:DNA-binding GntR family transcriptional regulator
MSVTWENFRAKRTATPVYVQLADFIEGEIKAGRLAADTQLPSQRELGELTGHSTETAGKAMGLLRERGLVETSTIGTFVANPENAS